MPKPKASRKAYTNEYKLDLVKRHRAGETPSQISAATGVPASNISKWNQLADDLEKAVPHHKKARAPDEPELDAGMLLWVRDMRQAGAPLTETHLSDKAEQLAAQFNIVGFKGSNGWVEKFKERHGLTAKVRKIN